MNAADLVRLECRRETAGTLAVELERFGAAKGEPEWLVPAVWLCTETSDYLASSSTKVMRDGFIARPLAIERTDEFERRLGSELPDIATRLVARRSDLDLPDPATPKPPVDLEYAPPGGHCLTIIIRVCVRAAAVHRVASGLLFAFEGAPPLLVGTDPGTAAMVISRDRPLIARYIDGCELLDAADYLGKF